MNEGMQWEVSFCVATPRDNGNTSFATEVAHSRRLTDEMKRRICDAVTKAVAVEMIHIDQDLREGRLPLEAMMVSKDDH